MGNEEKIERLLGEYQKLIEKMNEINEGLNQVGTDSEDMIPGHDDGQEFWARMEMYKMMKAQAESVRKQLRELGYKKAL